MRLYYEAHEHVEFDEQGDFIRMDITDMTREEMDTVQSAIEDVMSGKIYTLQKHYCLHEDHNNQPCVTEIIK